MPLKPRNLFKVLIQDTASLGPFDKPLVTHSPGLVTPRYASKLAAA